MTGPRGDASHLIAPQRLASEARSILSDEGALVVEWGDVLLSLWGRAIDTGDLEVIESELRQLNRRMMGIVAIKSSAPVPESELRQRMSDFSFDPRYFAGSVVVFKGSGLRASIVRSVMIGIRLMVRGPIPTHVTGDVDDAVRWARATGEGLRVPDGLAGLISHGLASFE